MAVWGPFHLGGKNAIVTGGASGIGFGMAKSFIEAGANVLIADLDEAGARSAAEQLTQGPGKASWIAVDVSADDAGQVMGSMSVSLNSAQ